MPLIPRGAESAEPAKSARKPLLGPLQRKSTKWRGPEVLAACLYQAWVATRDSDWSRRRAQQPLQNVLAPAKMNTPHASSFVAVSEWPFEHQSGAW